MERLEQQLSFVIELDKLKTILRQTLLTDGSRRENTAEHSWHLAVMASVLAEYASEPVDVCKVTRILLMHDIIEIDAGDTFAYDVAANETKVERELLAAKLIFGLLPSEQGNDLRRLWEEFESVTTAEAQFANAIDRLQPFLQNTRTDGGTWRMHHVARQQVLKRMDPVRLYLPKIWPQVLAFIESACARGWVKKD